VNFYKTDIAGKLIDVHASSGWTFIKVQNYNEEFAFSPNTSEINQNSIFSYIAEKGDSLIKTAYSDTLILIKKGEVYRYTFEKY
jgi:hypothetical protein